MAKLSFGLTAFHVVGAPAKYAKEDRSLRQTMQEIGSRRLGSFSVTAGHRVKVASQRRDIAFASGKLCKTSGRQSECDGVPSQPITRPRPAMQVDEERCRGG